MDSEIQQTPTAEKRCVIYCRKSSSDGLDRDYTSIDCQTDTCKAYIERHAGEGWRFTGRVYADGGFSGGTTNRPEFQKMMDSVRAGEVDVVVIYKLDRISRNKRDFWNLVHEFRQYNVTIVTATQFVEMQTSGGRAATGVLMDFAEYEREIDSERINGQIRAARMAGRWASAATPYGYAKTQHAELVVDEEAAKRVRFIFERYLVIKSARQVAIELNERFGDKEPGKPWRTANVYRILENIAYKGYVMYKDREYKGIHTPLVTEQGNTQVRALRRRDGTDVHEQARAAVRVLQVPEGRHPRRLDLPDKVDCIERDRTARLERDRTHPADAGVPGRTRRRQAGARREGGRNRPRRPRGIHRAALPGRAQPGGTRAHQGDPPDHGRA